MGYTFTSLKRKKLKEDKQWFVKHEIEYKVEINAKIIKTEKSI